MLSKEEIENVEHAIKNFNGKLGDCVAIGKMLAEYKQLESDKQKLIEKLEERIKSVEKCYQDLIKPYYDEKLNIINTSYMNKKEKEEFINKINCLLVQKASFEEILEILKGEKNA